MNFLGKVVLITGSGSGLVGETAKYMARLGANLSLAGPNEKSLVKVSSDCRRLGGRQPLITVGDVVDECYLQFLVDKTILEYGKLDILIIGGGIVQYGSIEEPELMNQFDNVFDFNVRPNISIISSAVQYLEKTKGNIVNISSLAGIKSFPDLLVYSMSKRSLDQMTRCTALELAPKGIRVNAVNTVVMDSPERFTGDSCKYGYLLKVTDYHPLARLGIYQEVASVIGFLASDEASFITGVTIPVDGVSKVYILQHMENKGVYISFSNDFLFQTTNYRRGAVLDITCQEAQSFIDIITKERAFGMHTEWFLLSTYNSTDDFYESSGVVLISGTYALPDSCVVMALVYEEEDTVEYYDVYRTSIDSKMKFLLLARQKLSNMTIVLPKYERKDFEGVSLRVGNAILFPKIFEGFNEEPNYGEVDTYAKMGHLNFLYIAEELNMSYTFRIFNSHGYLENGSFTDLMGTLVKGDLDVGIGLIMRDDRFDIIDFAGSTYQIFSPLIFRQPSLSSVSNIYALPFQKYVWLTTSVMAFVCAIILFLELFIIHRKEKAKRYSFLEVTMSIIEDVCQQGSSLELNSTPAKFTCVLFSILSFFLFIAYSAKIVALLQSTSATIRTLPEMTNSHLEIKMQNISYNRLNFKESSDKDILEFYYKKIYPQGVGVFISEVDGISKIKLRSLAYKVETNWGYKMIGESFNEEEKCGLSEMNVFKIPSCSFGFPKKSGFREHFSRSFTWQQETGLFQRTKKLFLLEKPACNSKTSGYTRVNITVIEPALLVLLYGIIGSIVLFLIEVFDTYKFCLNIYRRYI